MFLGSLASQPPHRGRANRLLALELPGTLGVLGKEWSMKALFLSRAWRTASSACPPGSWPKPASSQPTSLSRGFIIFPVPRATKPPSSSLYCALPQLSVPVFSQSSRMGCPLRLDLSLLPSSPLTSLCLDSQPPCCPAFEPHSHATCVMQPSSYFCS